MKIHACLAKATLVAAAVTFFAFSSILAPGSRAQIRQTALYIDNGSGAFTVLTAPGTGGTLTLPSGPGTLLMGPSGGSGAGVSLQTAALPGTQQTGFLNLSGDGIFGGNVLIGNTTGTSPLSVGSSAQLTIDGSGNLSTSGTLTSTSTGGITTGGNSLAGKLLISDGAATANYATINAPSATNAPVFNLPAEAGAGPFTLATTSGFGTMAPQNANAVAITGGTASFSSTSGVTPLSSSISGGAASTNTALTLTASGGSTHNYGMSFTVSGTGAYDVVGTGVNWSVDNLGNGLFNSATVQSGGGIVFKNGLTILGISAVVGATSEGYTLQNVGSSADLVLTSGETDKAIPAYSGALGKIIPSSLSENGSSVSTTENLKLGGATNSATLTAPSANGNLAFTFPASAGQLALVSQIPATGWSLTGNSGTNPATNFIGTTDNVALKFKVNSNNAGMLDEANRNVSLGVGTLQSVTPGSPISFNGRDNTAMGHYAGLALTSGYYNTAIGSNALYTVATSAANTAVGYLAMQSSADGSDHNTAVGVGALASSNTYSECTAVGVSANVTGGFTDATAIGYNAHAAASNTIQFGDANVTAVSTYGHSVNQGTQGVVTNGGGIITSATGAGTDAAGTITFTTSGAGSGTITLTFASAYTYPTLPVVVLTPATLNALTGATYWVSTTSTTLTINVVCTAAQAGAKINYMVVGY